MASRRSKDKGPTASHDQIIKREPVSPGDIANRLTTLGSIPKPNYSSVLVSAYDPYALTPVNQPVRTIYPRKPNASQYVKKQYFQNLFFVEPNRAAIKNPLQIAKSYFPPLCHWVPEHGAKRLEFYSDILRQEDATVIKTIFDLDDKNKIIYHSVYLKNIVTEASWGHSPTFTKSLPKHSVPYSYHDYIDAWFKFMLHQNETMTHSWFINFDKEFDNNADLPLWFIRWWNQFGSDIEIFPKPLVDCFNFWKQGFKVNTHNAKFPALLHFVKHFRVPWILKWQYEKDGDILSRHWYVKWWDKFGYVSQILDNVYRRLPPKQLISSAQSTSKAPSTSSDIDKLSKDDLYALLKKKIEEEKEAENRNSEEEGSVAESPVAESPCYPYPQPYPKDWFAHDEEYYENTPDLGA
ncbi:hypothetical protein ACB092_07G015100 [Castanea dentata]